MRLPMLLPFLGLALSAQGAVNHRGAFSAEWNRHKAGHFMICGSITWGCAKLKHPKLAFGLAMTLGLAKELHDVRHGESQLNLRRDLLIDFAGAYAGYWLATRNSK